MKFKRLHRDWLKLSLLGLTGFYFASCSNTSYESSIPAPASTSAIIDTVASEAPQEVVAKQSNSKIRSSTLKPVPYKKPSYRPGLATEQGRKISSNVNTVYFERSSETKPKGTAVLYYNDEEGVDAMTSKTWKTEASGLQSTAGGLVEWGVRSGFRYNKNYYSGGKRFILGKKGREYSLVVKNKCHSRLEIVLSVDGLNILNGQQASVKQKGYVVGPGKTLVVKGFRTAQDTVRAFKFSDVQSSVSQQLHGTTKNVGVMGIAVFTEKGVNPWRWTPDVVAQRLDADAFQ